MNPLSLLETGSILNQENKDLLAIEIKKKFLKKIQKVLLIAPPDVDATLFDYDSAKRGNCRNYAPYGLGLIATLLRKEGLDVDIVNLNHGILKEVRQSQSSQEFDFDRTWKNAVTSSLIHFQPDIVGLTCMFSQTHRSAVHVCNEIRQINSTLVIACGGVHITNSFNDHNTQKLLLNDFKNSDFFFLYEAERAFKKFIEIINQKSSLEDLCQVYFNSSSHPFYFSNKKLPTGEDLDVIPAHDLMSPDELQEYGVVGSFYALKEKNVKITTVLSNRGCRAQCTFCSVRNFNGIKVRQRSVQSVIDELLMLQEKFNIDRIMWLGDDLFYNHRRTVGLFNEMVRQKIRITWDCTNGVIAASCTDEIISAAAESGCIGLTIGVESGNPGILRQIKKPGTVDTFLKAAEVLKRHETINARVFLMIGFPDETHRMMLDTFHLAKKMDLDWYNITATEPLPNTPMFEAVMKKNPSSEIKFEEIRYNSGPYGKLSKSVNQNAPIYKTHHPFENVDLESVAPKEALKDIWFYFNFHLNFKRLLGENRPIKLQQQFKYLNNIITLIAPADPFPLYFYGYLQNKIYGAVEKSVIHKLSSMIASSHYWKSKFDYFGLSVTDLERPLFTELGRYQQMGKRI